MGSAAQPDPSLPPASSRGEARGSVLPGTIDRRDVPWVVSRCLDEAAAAGPITADCRELLEPGMPAVDALARLALAAARGRRGLRLEHASPALLDLLRLCGLDEALTRDVPRHAEDPG